MQFIRNRSLSLRTVLCCGREPFLAVHIHARWLTHTWDMNHSYMRTCFLLCLHSQFFFFCDVTRLCVRHDSFIRTRWLNHTCNVTHSYMWHDAFMQVAWLVHTWEMTHSYMRHDAFIHVTWLIHIWAPSLARPPCLVLQLRFESRKVGRGGLAQRRAWGGELGCAWGMCLRALIGCVWELPVYGHTCMGNSKDLWGSRYTCNC